MTKILMVEDEKHLAIGLQINFEYEGFVVDIVETVREAKEKLKSAHKYEVIILDLTLPDGDGFEVCSYLRKNHDFTPILMLTARNTQPDRVKGIELGADDYMSKPFDLDELMVRVRSLVRRQKWNSMDANQAFTFGNASIDFTKYEAKVNDSIIKLTALEFDLLRFFMNNQNRVISRQELLTEVWKLPNYPQTRTVDNFIMRLRRRFEPDPANPTHFHSIRGAGYKFTP